MGMLYGICGMTALIVGFWVDTSYTYANGPWLIAVSMAPGAFIGLWSAYIVGMTSLPEMVGLYNGFGGFAAALTGYGQYLDPTSTYLVRHDDLIAEQTDAMLFIQAIALILSIVIGMMTFTGSIVAALKLHGLISSKSWVVPFRSLSSLLMVVAMIIFGVLPFAGDQHWNDRGAGIVYLAIVGLVAGLYGYLAVMAIGGGDMPVSIAFLNSLSGFSTSAAGLMLNNKALVVSGAFVGCSGIILTLVMCNAMNRSVANVLLGGFGEGSKTVAQTKSPQIDDSDHGVVKEISAEDVVEILTSAGSVIVVPGYGMVSLRFHRVKLFLQLLNLNHIPPGGSKSATFHQRTNDAFTFPRNFGSLCHPSGGGTYARSYERIVGRSASSI
jgi:NAD/NADP transhydrogenase beta subunit